MKLEQSFTVTAPIEQVWDMLVDVERIAPCLPGADITGQAPDGGYEGTFSVKLGPATAAYRGHLKMDSLDEAARTATMHANGTDKRGQGGAHAVIVSTLRQEGDETTVDVVTDFSITGRLARFGRGGMIEDISKRLMRDFAQCLQATLAAEQDAGLAPMAAPDAATVFEEQAAAEAEPAAPAEPEPTAAEAAAAAPLPGQESPAGDEPLQPAQAPWPPRASEPEEAEPPAPAAEEAEPPAPAAEEAAPPAPAAEGAAPAEPLAAEPEPAAPAAEEAAPAAEEAAPAEPLAGEPAAPVPPAAPAAAPRTGSIPPPSAAPRPVAAQQAKPIKGFSLFFGVLWDRIKRFFARLFGRKREN
jgi:carbon monoxide dehydrogenase subunit G